MWRLILILCITGCTPVSPEFYRNRVTIEFIPSTSSEIIKECGASSRGCVRNFAKDDAVCYIYAKEPKWMHSTAWTTIGKDLGHCMRGRYHWPFKSQLE